MKLHVSYVIAVCALTVAAPSVAFAQTAPPADTAWLRDRRYTEGAGYRVGDLEIHPGLGAEVGYDSNYLLLPSTLPSDPSLHLKAIGSLSVATIGPERKEAGAPPPDFTFRGGLNATYNELVPLASNANTDTLRNSRNVAGGVDLALGILPTRPWSGRLYGSLTRSVVPSEQGVVGNFTRDTPIVGAELAYQPGGGLLDWRVGYSFTDTLFESKTSLSNSNNEITTRGRWRFLPRTALMYEGRFGFINYSSPEEKTGSHPVRTRIGINGLITPSLAVLALVGWGASFYTPTGQQNFDSVIGQAELKYYLTPNPSSDPGAVTLSLSSVALGFTRDFADSFIGTYYERDRGYLALSYFFSGRFLLVGTGGVAAIRYPSLANPPAGTTYPTVSPGSPWTDTRIDATLFGEYRFASSLGINLTFQYDQNISSTSISSGVGPTGATTSQSLAYNRFQAYLGFRWFM